jgi:hypothetical protein
MAYVSQMIFVREPDTVDASDGRDGTKLSDWISIVSSSDRTTVTLSLGQTDAEQVAMADKLIAAATVLRDRSLARLAGAEDVAEEARRGLWSKPHHGGYCDHYATNSDGTSCERCGAERVRPGVVGGSVR